MAADTTYQGTGLQRRRDGTTALPTGGSLDIESGASLKIAGTAVSASAAELNLVDGSTAGTAVASKAAVLGANKELDEVHAVKLYVGAAAGTEVTASAAELNLIDGSSAGTAVAGKAAVLGTDKNLDELHVAALYLGAAAGTQVSRTAAELNAIVQGAAAGYKIARGSTTITQASQDVATGLATVVAAVASMSGDPSMTHMFSTCTIGNQTGQPAAGSIRIKSWKPTAADNCAPLAADTVFGGVDWIAIGT
jgi:hypothetical protein